MHSKQAAYVMLNCTVQNQWKLCVYSFVHLWKFCDVYGLFLSLIFIAYLMFHWAFHKLIVNSSPPSAAYMHQWAGSSLVQVKACRLFGAKPLPEPMLTYCQIDSWEQILVKFKWEFYHFHSRKCIWNVVCQNGGHFVQGEMSYRRAMFFFYNQRFM